MSLVINTNMMSLNAQAGLAGSQATMQTQMQRLSTGLKINSAADDAAGLAIATGMTTQINGTNQAISNANNGVGLMQTAEGALTSITNNLQTISQLAVEAANGTNSAADRTALDTQAQQLLSEINRVAQNTSFNGVQLLDGSNSGFTFQVGSGTTASDTFSVNGMSSATLQGLGTTSTYTTAGNGIATGSTGTLNGTAGVAGTDNGVAVSGLTAAISSQSLTIAGTGTNSSGAAFGTATISLSSVNAPAGTGAQGQQVVDAINAQEGKTGVTAYVNSTGKIELSQSGTGFTVTGASGALSSLGTAPTSTTALNSLSLNTADSATNAINQVASALKQISSAQAVLGASQNRLTSIVSNLTTSATNLTQARSSVQDTDFAATTAAFTQASILQQAGTSVLAQANMLPKNTLSLLQNL